MPDTPPLSVRVKLDERSYDILIGPGLISAVGKTLTPLLKRPRVFVISDGNVAGLHAGALEAGLQPAGITMHLLAVEPGESSKSWDGLGHVLDWLLESGAGRDDILVALGGGVVGDLGGLAASLLKRGMGFVQIPTTLLAQVDSSVGGKTAVNARFGKNLVGAFYQPRLVLADTDMLATLPDRERRAGYAEIVKYGLIDNAEFFEWLEVNGTDVIALKPEALSHAVATSCASKARIVAADEREGGVRALLNFGHTFGHALEAANGFGPALLHGEGVACGMVLALRYSVRCGLMKGQDAERAANVLKAGGLETDIARLAGGPYLPSQLVEAMKQDKKARAGRVPLILARGLGRSFIQPDADLSDVETFLKEELKRGCP